MGTCVNNIAKNIGMDCDAPIVSGFTGRGVLIPLSINPTLTKNVENPRIIEAIAIPEQAKVCAIDNEGTSPFEGTAVASNGDSGFVQYSKTVSVRIPMRGAGNSKDIVEPITKSGQGFIVILERRDKVGDGSFLVVGALQPLRANVDGITQSETENGGAVMATMSCVEQWFECTFYHTDYETTKADFEALLAKAF